MALDTTTVLIGGAILLLLLFVFAMSWGGRCNCSEGYKASQSGQFSAKRPKYMVEPTHPMKSPGHREGFIIPYPSKAQMLKSDNLHGGTIGPLSNPYMGGLAREAQLGVSTPPQNTATLTSGNGAKDPGSLQVWSTVV